MSMYMHGHENDKYSIWYPRYRTCFDGVYRIRRILNEQRVIDWKALFLARQIEECQYVLLELLKMRMKIALEAINVALSSWNKEMIQTLLEYDTVEIDNEVIRFVAGNIKYGKDIMESLLAQEMGKDELETL